MRSLNSFSVRLSEVVNKIQGAAQQGLSFLRLESEINGDKKFRIPRVSELSTNPLKKTDYLTGQEPDWSDIQSGRAIEREDDIEIKKIVESQLDVKGLRGIIVITGTAGSGKSSSLIRSVLGLTARGYNVGWIDRDIDCSIRDMVLGMRGEDAPDILAIDDADVYGPDLSPALREIAVGESRPLIFLEIRSGRIDRAVVQAQLNDVPLREISMRHLSNHDIEALLDVLDRDNRLGVLKGKSQQQRINAFKEQAGRQLLVAMYQATSGMKFETRVQEELFELEGDDQFIYGLVAVATNYRFGLSREEIVLGVGDRSNATLNIIDRLIRRHLCVVSGDGTQIRVRHRVVARILTDQLQERGMLADILYGLIVVGAVKVRPHMSRSSRPYRMLRTFLNHDLLFRMMDAEQARNLYGSIEELLRWEENYWLQRGSLEVEVGDLRLAENFLGQARSLAPEHPYVANEWAYLLFKKAIEAPGSSEAGDLVNEATEILTGLVAAQRGRNVYPFHVLGSQGLAWARRGIRSEDERRQYLRTLVDVVQEGTTSHPESEELRQLEGDLRREILSLSVPTRLRE